MGSSCSILNNDILENVCNPENILNHHNKDDTNYENEEEIENKKKIKRKKRKSYKNESNEINIINTIEEENYKRYINPIADKYNLLEPLSLDIISNYKKLNKKLDNKSTELHLTKLLLQNKQQECDNLRQSLQCLALNCSK